MSNNTLMKVVQKISASNSKEDVYKLMYDVLCEIDEMYSVIVYYDNNEDTYVVQYNLSQNDDYNTVKVYDVVTKVV